MRYEEPGKDESLPIQPKLQDERIVLPPMRLIPPMRLLPPTIQVEWMEPPTVQSIVPHDTRQTSGAYGELLSPSSRDPSYGVPVMPVMLPQSTLDSPSANFKAMPFSLPTTFEGAYLASDRGNLLDNIVEPPCTSPLRQQCCSLAFRIPVSARYRSYRAMTPHPYSIEQTPFPHASDLPDACEVGAVPEKSKRKNRRGNLPKEATKKLNTWFMENSANPYPTDVVKQELMRQTNLNYNQISNWFINARRRRKLPAMTGKLQIERDPGSAQSAPSVISSDSPLLDPDQEVSVERPDMVDIDCCAGCQIDGRENGSDSEKQF